MQTSITISCVYAFISLVSAIPTPIVEQRSPPTQLPSVIHGFPPGDWECVTNSDKGTTRVFTSDYLQRSTEFGLELRDNGDNKAGNSKYPDWIQNPGGIPGLEEYKDDPNVDHFPLNYDNQNVFTGGRPGTKARVFYSHERESDEATFIGVWTHEGAPSDGEFVPCTKV